MVWFVERLTLRTWLCSLLPRLIRARVSASRTAGRCYVFDASRAGLWTARAFRWLTGMAVEVLHFRLVDVRDEDGLLLRLRIAFKDLAEVQAEVMKDPLFREAISHEVMADSLFPAFLMKAIVSTTPWERETLWRALLITHVCAWKLRGDRQVNVHPLLFLDRRPWLAAVSHYAAVLGIAVVPVWAPPTLRVWLRNQLSPASMRLLRRLVEVISSRPLRRRWGRRPVGPPALRASDVARRGGGDFANHGPRIAVEYYGHLNLTQPERYSDLFFLQQSSLSASDLSVLFDIPRDPINEQKRDELAQHGLTAVALRPQATTLRDTFIFTPRSRPRLEPMPPLRRDGPTSANGEWQWLRQRAMDYGVLRAYWEELLVVTGTKVYVTWFKYDASHCAIAAALEHTGGILAIYQRAYDSLPSAEAMITADVVFGYAPAVADQERRAGSMIRYFVATGYLGDHRFPFLREETARIRRELQQRGATRILSFTDENSMDDARWHTGHEFQQHNYAFLLEKVLSEPWLGLVVKPKVPSTLRRRLGQVAELLHRAEVTGRCVVLEAGALHNSYPPAAAALASDLAIHGHLCAGTAGLESALAGVPTLLLDREGWSVSPLYRLGVGRVVFTEWPALWNACLEHWKSNGGVPGFGDWSSMLDELDPFRDGRAAERMGTYLVWLLEGFKAGLSRETVMADAAERYGAQWGKDKVTQVNGRTSGAESGASLAEPVTLARETAGR